MIIGINGRVGSGKDTVGRIIQYLIRSKQDDGFSSSVKLEETFSLTVSDPFHSGWEIKKYAEKLKQIASLLTGIPREKFEDQEFKKQPLSRDWTYEVDVPGYGKNWVEMTVRTFLQRLGTEGIRDGVHTNAWVNALFADYKIYDSGNSSNWIITDCRFPNEAKAITNKGGIVIRVTRPGENLGDLHPSETSLDDWKFDHILENNGSVADLKDKVAFFLTTNKLL